MKAPFPWFGGKSRVAHLVWERFGNVPNYVEPFAGSLAVLLARPCDPGTETVNDADAYLSNFWRAVANDPDEVARLADWPVNEADLLARHDWLLAQAEFRERMRRDAHYFDSKVAGWWLWGVCSWIGAGWCHTSAEKLPHLGNPGMGINRKKLPHLGDPGRGEAIAANLRDLQARLRDVRVSCGDWQRVLGPSVTFRHGVTGVFLDPPYDAGCVIPYAERCSSAEVCGWAIANGNNPELRIALCGYEGEHDMPGDWEAVAWKAAGGYGSQGEGAGRENAERERIWFSPHCLGAGQLSLLNAPANEQAVAS